MHRAIHIGTRVVASFALLASVSCTKLVELEVHYEECVRTRAPYLEEFEGGNQDLLDRCWKTENVANEREFHSGGGDMVLGYSDSEANAVAWDEAPPMLLRRFEGDFVMATKAETSVGSDSGFCGLEVEDAAGIIVRGADADGGIGARASFLVRAYPIEDTTCGDDPPDPPAIVEARMEGTDNVYAKEGLGADGEADIAVCRKGSTLYYFYHRPDTSDETWGERWQALDEATVDAGDAGGAGGAGSSGLAISTNVGDGPLDVGLTTTLASVNRTFQVLGTFNWVTVRADGDLGAEDCKHWLDFEEPSSD